VPGDISEWKKKQSRTFIDDATDYLTSAKESIKAKISGGLSRMRGYDPVGHKSVLKKAEAAAKSGGKKR
jgi:hypothetical protein